MGQNGSKPAGPSSSSSKAEQGGNEFQYRSRKMRLHEKEETRKGQEVYNGIFKENDLEKGSKIIETSELNMKTENTDSPTPDKKEHANMFEINVAIDFGTTFTGFAYSYRNNKNEIYSGKRKLGDDRISTVVLFKPDGTVDSMGRNAETTYGNLLILNKAKDFRLFRHFKMALYKKDKLALDEPINDTDGKSIPAFKLFQAVISFMRNCAIEMIKDSLHGDKNKIDDIVLWILTIPAIWSDSARQLMKEAAVGAGINERQLLIVLEPEAASIHCRKDFLIMTDTSGAQKLPVGTKYILADLGGGTADICSHEIMADDSEGREKIRELFRATGGAFGGTYVDNKFIEFMINVFGKDTWDAFKCSHFDDYLRLIHDFEECKLKFDLSTEEFVITVPHPLIDMLQQIENCTLEERIQNPMFANVKRNKLICKQALMKAFFEESVDGILFHLKRILSQCKREKIEVLLLVGGFAESQYVKRKITEEMHPVRVIVGRDPSLSVMKGAVMLGYENRKIMQRRSKFTYGFGIALPFVEGIHPEELKFQRDGEFLCGRIFDKLIEQDQYVEYNQEFKTSISSSRKFKESKRETVYIGLYTSEMKNPKYCTTEMECTEVGQIRIPPPPEGWPDLIEYELCLTVKESKMTCKIVDHLSDVREFDVDFLSRVIEL